MPSDFAGLRSDKWSSKVEWFWMDGLSVCSFWFSIVLGCSCLFRFDCFVAFWNLAVWRLRHLKACWTSRCVKMRINLPLLGTGRRIRPGWWFEDWNILPWPVAAISRLTRTSQGCATQSGLSKEDQLGSMEKSVRLNLKLDDVRSVTFVCSIRWRTWFNASRTMETSCLRWSRTQEIQSLNEVKQMDAKGTFMNLIKSVFT